MQNTWKGFFLLLKFLFDNRFLKICDSFKDFGNQSDDNILFVGGCFRIRRYAKNLFPKDGVGRLLNTNSHKLTILVYKKENKRHT